MNELLPFALAALLLIVGLPIALYVDWRRTKSKTGTVIVWLVLLVVLVAAAVFGCAWVLYPLLRLRS